MPESVRSLVQRKIDALDDNDRRLLGAAASRASTSIRPCWPRYSSGTRRISRIALERLEREHALVRFVDEHETDNRQLTLRYRFAHHIYHNAFDTSLRATRRADAQPRDCAATDCAARRSAVRLRRGQSRCCSSRRATTFAPPNTGIRRRRRPRGSTRTTKPSGSRAAASRCLKASPTRRAKSAAELGLQMTYGLCMKTSRGYAVPEVGRAYARARELCHQIDDPARVVPVLIGMSAHHIVAGEITTARDVALEMLDLFNRLGDPNLQMIGQWSLGAALFHLGELEVGHEHLARALDCIRSVVSQAPGLGNRIDPGIFCRCELARTLTMRGFPDQGLQSCGPPSPRRGRSNIRSRSRLRCCSARSSISPPRAGGSLPRLRRAGRALPRARYRAGTAVGRAASRPCPHRAGPDRSRAWRNSKRASPVTPSPARPSCVRYYLVLLAGGLLRANQLDEALAAITSRARLRTESSQHSYDAENRRLLAEILLAMGDHEGTERAYLESLEIAPRRREAAIGTPSIVTRLRELPDQESAGPKRPARSSRSVCDSITEGRDTYDFVYADALLKTI